MPLKLTWYWFEFDVKPTDKNIPPGVIMGCGLTAYNYEDALVILTKSVFKQKAIPQIKKVIENVDLSTLDERHILPNIVIPSPYRGVWFPQSYSFLN